MAKSRSISPKLTRILEKAADPVYLLDADRAILFCNPACAAWIGVEAEELVGRRVDYVAGDELHGVPGAAAGLCPPPDVFAGRAMTGHVSSMSSQGRLLYRRTRFMPLVDGSGSCLAVLAFMEHADLHAVDLQGATPRASATSDQLHATLRQFRAELGSRHALAQLLGETPAQKQVRARVALAASSRAAVLICGPEGTEREAVARTIHERAARGGGRFAKVDAALLTADLLAQALTDLRAGEVSPTETTLLLHDVDRLQYDLHATVLKLVRNPAGTRVLATSRVAPDVWEAQLPAGNELPWLLATLVIELPPLAARIADLPLLAQALVEECNRAGAKQLSGVSTAALEQLAWHDWPGNLHELREVIRMAHETASGLFIEPGDLSPRLAFTRDADASPRPAPDMPINLDNFLRDVQIELIERALDRTGGNRTKAAKLLGITRIQLYRRLERFGMVQETSPDEPVFEEDPE